MRSCAAAGQGAAALSSIDASTGSVCSSFVTAPNFEVPADSDHNNSYIVQVRASDGSLSDDQTITVNVTNVVEVPPIDGGFAGDLSGDGKSDIVITNSAGGNVFLWQMDGFTPKALPAIGSLGPEWHLADNADFNGDNVNDILWRADNGTVMTWQMQGGIGRPRPLSGRVGNEWRIGGTGDFDGDNTDDILWQRTDGTLLQFQMQNGPIHAAPTFGQIGPEWHDVGIGDFNGDGKSDILWRRDDGALLDFQMNGTQVNAQAVGQVGLEWHVEGIADFNGDGKTDILGRTTAAS